MTVTHKKDMGLGVAAIAFGAWMFAEAMQLKSGPDFWPKVVAAGIILLGALIFVMGLMGLRKAPAAKGPAKEKAKPQYIHVAAVMVVLVAYYFAFQTIGYTIPTFLMIGATAYILGYRNWKVLLPTSLLTSIALYLVFTKLFGIRFPGAFF